MPIVNKTKRTAAIYNRGREVVKVYDHGTLAWQKSLPDYLCFTALEAGQFTLTIPAAVTPTYLSYVEWSKDGRTWTHTDNTSDEVTIPVSVASGDKVYWRGSAKKMSNTQDVYSNFASTCNFDASGNILSLLFADDFQSATAFLENNALTGLFRNNTKLIHAHDITMPSFTRAGCFLFIFGGCTNLVSAPDLPALTVEGSSYYAYCDGCSSLQSVPTILATTATGRYVMYRMFRNCTSLQGGVSISVQLNPIGVTDCQQAFHEMFYGCTGITSATITTTGVSPLLFEGCFRGCTSLTAIYYTSPTTTANRMFRQMCYGCTSLTTAFTLNATTLDTRCCEQMFYGCSSLNHVKCMATDISATDCTLNWLASASSTGTFIQAEGVEWPRGASGIPTGWLAYDEGEEIPNDYTPCDYIFNPSSASAAAVAIGTTSGINEPFEVDFQATEIVASDRPIAGYGSSNTSVSPVQGSMSYFYLRNNPDSFQHQVFRLNTSGDTIASTNGLLKNGRDLDRHTAKVTYTYNESTEHYLRNLYFDGVLTHSSTVIHPTPLIGTEFYVFGFSSSSGRFINGKIYGLRRWEEDEVTLKANLIPCSRNSDGAAGFWDTAQKKFFTSTYWTAHFDNE